MDPRTDLELLLTRRQLFGRAVSGVGTAALAALLSREGWAATAPLPGKGPRETGHGTMGSPHFAPKAKRVVCLHMSGGPSHIDLWDYKPKLKEYNGTELPASVRMGQRITGMTSG